jgi:hypothetical protein
MTTNHAIAVRTRGMIARIFAAPPLARRSLQVLVGLIAVGTLARLLVAFGSQGVGFDIQSYVLVRDTLFGGAPLDLYATINTPEAPHWPYPPGFFAWIALSKVGHDVTGLRFDGFVQVAPILADAALAWVVQAFLGQRGASDRTRLAAAALVALGPSFAFISGYHGQLDAVAILPAVIALWAWMRLDGPQRAVVAGLLIGAGGSVKLPALVVALALVPTARSVREGLTLLVTAAAVPLALFAPFLAANLHGTVEAMRMNDGLPGFGGFSLLVQPDLSALWLRTDRGMALSEATRDLMDLAAPIALTTLLATAAILLVRRAQPVAAAVLVFVTIYAFGVNFGVQYLVWGMPFFLLAGHVRNVAILQAVALTPSLLLYGVGSRDAPLHEIYTPFMLAIWIGFVVTWFVLMRRLLTSPAPSPAAEPADAAIGRVAA